MRLITTGGDMSVSGLSVYVMMGKELTPDTSDSLAIVERGDGVTSCDLR